MNDLNALLENAVETATKKPVREHVSWSRYWPHTQKLRDAGWSYARIYAYFSAKLEDSNMQMPGTLQRFTSAMSRRDRLAQQREQ